VRTAAPLFRKLSLLCAALLCCACTLARPAHADSNISVDTTIDTVINDSLFVVGSATVTLVPGGGTAYFRDLWATGNSTINVAGGSVGGVLVGTNAGTINVSSGYVFGGPAARNTSTVNVTGGYFGDGFQLEGSGTTLNIYGTGLSLSGPYPGWFSGDTVYYVIGTLANRTPIYRPIHMFEGAQLSQVHLYDVGALVVLNAQVQALADAGAVNQGNANALLVKLAAAQIAQAADDTAGERGALTAFINQTQAFVRTHKLTSAQGTVLISAAQAILNGLG
jgi:hypothetical protein